MRWRRMAAAASDAAGADVTEPVAHRTHFAQPGAGSVYPPAGTNASRLHAHRSTLAASVGIVT